MAQESVTVAQGESVQLSVDATFSDGSISDASSQVRWIVGDGTVAQFDGEGLLEGISLGSTTVRVEWDGVSSDAVPVQVVEEVRRPVATSTSTGSAATSRMESLTWWSAFATTRPRQYPESADLFVDKDFEPPTVTGRTGTTWWSTSTERVYDGDLLRIDVRGASRLRRLDRLDGPSWRPTRTTTRARVNR